MLKEMEKNYFKKGDAVICDDYGVGYVVNIDIDDLFTVEVEFQSYNSIVGYTADGRPNKDAEITLKKSDHTWIPG